MGKVKGRATQILISAFFHSGFGELAQVKILRAGLGFIMYDQIISVSRRGNKENYSDTIDLKPYFHKVLLINIRLQS